MHSQSHYEVRILLILQHHFVLDWIEFVLIVVRYSAWSLSLSFGFVEVVFCSRAGVVGNCRCVVVTVGVPLEGPPSLIFPIDVSTVNFKPCG